MKRISPHVKMLTSALNRIIDVAPYKGTAYRGIRGSAEQIEHLYGLYKSNSFYVEPAFMSTTKNKESAQVFEKNTPNNIAFEIIINKGADIKAATQAPSEEEVMLIAGSRFKIDSAMKIENDKHLFKLIQI
ncbi:hypothetical protein AWM79_12240 [Pseudomonas agarici]|uniref:ADP ribosyltransferase domain-containing protein n=2 Tax=Pseudomonas agarici TaxID=46677 RepID=A0A0X1T1R3_PSEAA|nr:hypothetical protein AWM79_12240 [Pseudomonas agarici]